MSVDNPTLRWVGILIGFLFIAAALAACSGESSGPDAPRDEPQSQETESRNDDSVGAGDGDDTANGVRDEGQEDAAGLFVSVSAGYSQTCGVRSDGSVACWGDDEYGQATSPGAPRPQRRRLTCSETQEKGPASSREERYECCHSDSTLAWHPDRCPVHGRRSNRLR